MNRSVFFGVCLLALLSGRAAVLVATEPTVTTDSVDLFSEKQGPRKSPAVALASTLILPGSGHQYLERNRSALLYLTADAAWIFGYFFCSRAAGKTAVDAAGYAWIHAGALGTITGADDPYWRLVGNFMDTQEYNTVMELNRTPEKKITDESRLWHWDDKSSQNRYNALRSTSRTFGIVSSFFLGALVLDRVAAFIDIRSYLRKTGLRRGAAPSLEMQPSLTPSGPLFSLTLSAPL